ncbi:MAG: glycosyltransferase family 2 protein [Rhizomicrobium sp.]
MAEKPSVAVVIPSLNRESVVTDTVMELLDAPSRHMAELIVVDQSESENRRLATLADPRLVYRHVGFKNQSQARNYGTAMSRADVVLFLDDDVRGLADIVDAHARAHLRTDADLVTGPILSGDDKLIPAASLSAEQRAHLMSGKIYIANLGAEYVPAHAPSCNASFRRSLLVELGGFDEHFLSGPVAVEDAEITHRVRTAAGRIIFDPKAALVHLAARTGGTRDEADLLQRAEMGILNAHYFCHKIGGKSLATQWMLGVFRTQALNREALRSHSVATTIRLVGRLLRASMRARGRTARLLNASRQQRLTSGRRRYRRVPFDRHAGGAKFE